MNCARLSLPHRAVATAFRNYFSFVLVAQALDARPSNLLCRGCMAGSRRGEEAGIPNSDVYVNPDTDV